MDCKTIIIGSDHAGVSLKKTIMDHFSQIDFKDMGPTDETSVDYPDYAKKVCDQVLQHPTSLGILICGSGIGMSMAANKIKGIRAALVTSTKMATLTRQHNNANVLCLGSRVTNDKTNLAIVEAFLSATFEEGRHQRRIDKMHALES